MSGFNKIEILVIVAVILFMVTIFALFVLDLQKGIRDTIRKGDIESISRSLEAHFNGFDNQFCNEAYRFSYCYPQASWFENKKVPEDPLKTTYLNLPQNGDKHYLICAKLEKGGGNAGDNLGHPAAGGKNFFYCQSSQQ
jgi:hypothetical protein